ncbi:CrcB-like protein-domain-containing protein [Boeremia exigua]|uniref:CrcB-like protein-domain-containing protein n=1 Tax=Boeremia exigua TaxID=749465 RepID=UPI001E8E582E|nr:CrcB-like protein-domain-containing protein [Boeremia exigua]KAH6642064.1 CrcB-like protein-domain-containing protein [Boeremia exigua]
MADADDEPSRRESHFNEQRASLRSDTSHSESNPDRSRHHSLREQRQSLPRTAEHAAPDRADSETLPTPASPSLAPRTRPETTARREARREAARREKEDRRSKHSSTGHDSATSTSKARPRTASKGRNIDDLLSSPQSQNITALPTMADARHASPADRYHQSFATPRARRLARALTELYTVSFLIFFAVWGTLARLGLQALTSYPGAPVLFSELWANVAGSAIMGFLAEDTALFREEWGGAAPAALPADRPASPTPDPEKHHPVSRAAHAKVKKTIPLYIGLTTGFCGCFTSFSSFARDAFLALANDLPPTAPRATGDSAMALLAVLLTTTALCLAALKTGAHLAALMRPYTPALPFRASRRLLDPLFTLLGPGCWLAAALLSAYPPHPPWRANALFACVFAPLGCLARYYASLHLNPLLSSFPLGTFACNVFGTGVLGTAYDLQRVRIGGVVGGSVVGCQVLQGVQDGFCGGLTTVSTWVLELDGLRRGRAYGYGLGSVGAGVGVLVVVMGSVRWGVGWEAVVCGA